MSARSLAVLLLPLALSVPAPAWPGDGQTEFAAAFARVEKNMEAGRWKEAKALLGTALDAHANQPYVRERRDEVRAAWCTCAFELAVPNPGVAGIFSGEVASYDPKSGEIELRWERPKPDAAKKPKGPFPGDDFERSDLGFVLRAPFAGPHSIELSGKAIGQPVPCLIGCLEGAVRYEASFDAGSASELVRIDGDERRFLVSCTDIFNVGRPYVLKLTVRAKEIEGSCNGKRMLVADKLKTEVGRAGFRNVQAPDRIVVKGKIASPWVDEQLSARRAREREEFDEQHDASAELPEWLRKD